MKRLDSTDFESWDRFYRANFFNCIGGFKPLNLVATQSKTGVTNVAPFFSVLHIGAHPPLLSLLFRPHTVPHHTLENIYDQQVFSVNAVNRAMLEAAHQASANYDALESEFAAVGLSPIYGDNPALPFVKESKLRIGCRFEEKHLIAANQTLLVVARIEEVYVEEEAIDDAGKIRHEQLDTLTVNGLEDYYSVQFEQSLPYARPK